MLHKQSNDHDMARRPWEPIPLSVGGVCAWLFIPKRVPLSLIACIHGGGCNGGYFDLPSYSFTTAAMQAGHAVLAIDRPGHGASPAVTTMTPLGHTAPLIGDVVAKALIALGDNNLSVALFGHSIGGAVAMHCAAQAPDMLACLVTSGIGLQPTGAAMSWHAGLCDADNVLLPNEFFFGPEGSFDWRAPMAIRRCAEQWRRAEIDEVLLEWPRQFNEVAGRIAKPVLCILGEYERIWENDAAAIEAIKCSFTIGRARVEIAEGGGHLYEVHQHWSTHAKRIIAFVEEHIE